jgi:hypothetical protein
MLKGTGTFTFRGAHGVLTNERVQELHPARDANQTGSLSNYNTLASTLPQDTRVFFALQVTKHK